MKKQLKIIKCDDFNLYNDFNSFKLCNFKKQQIKVYSMLIRINQNCACFFSLNILLKI